jgi:hypothetical protein
MNSIRRIYFERGDMFVPLVRTPRDAYTRAARAVKRQQADAAARAVTELAGAQERALMRSLS